MKQLVAAALLIPTLVAGQNWDEVQIKSFNVKNNIHYLEGRGGNIGVLTGPEGTLIVDDQYAPLSDKIKASIGALTDQPVSHVVNTHYHGDHTGGNENFKNDGALIVAHENVRSRLGITFENTALKRTNEAKPESFWPTITFAFDTTFTFNEEEVIIIFAPNAHTDGDVLVYFKTSNVIHAGDCFVRYGYPFIDVSAGGTIDGLIQAQQRILAIADEDTKIIPGHGEIASVKDVQELLDMLESTRKIVADSKSSNVKLEDLIPTEPLADYHERWNGSFINSDLFVQLIYESL